MTPADLETAVAELHGSVSAAAKAWGVPRRTLYAWLSGERRIPGVIDRLVELERWRMTKGRRHTQQERER